MAIKITPSMEKINMEIYGNKYGVTGNVVSNTKYETAEYSIKSANLVPVFIGAKRKYYVFDKGSYGIKTEKGAVKLEDVEKMQAGEEVEYHSDYEAVDCSEIPEGLRYLYDCE